MELNKTKKEKAGLSDEEVKMISERSIHGWDKLNRMYAGIATNLEKYADGIIYLRIDNTERVFSSSYETALRFVRSWVHANAELKDAKGFVVAFYKTESTGFAIAFSAIANGSKALEENIARLKSTRDEEKKLVGIYSGLLAATDEWEIAFSGSRS